MISLLRLFVPIILPLSTGPCLQDSEDVDWVEMRGRKRAVDDCFVRKAVQNYGYGLYI